MSEFMIIRSKDLVYGLSTYLLTFDGLAEPNPGFVGAGAVLYHPDQKTVVFERGEARDYGTNNQAEYLGLQIGLESAAALGIKSLLIQGDSNLVVNQVAGRWKVRDEKLKEFHVRIMNLLDAFDHVGIRHVYRNMNQHADTLTNEVAQSKKGFYREFTFHS